MMIGYVKAVTAAVNIDCGDSYRAFLGDITDAYCTPKTMDARELAMTTYRMRHTMIGDIFDLQGLVPCGHDKWAAESL